MSKGIGIFCPGCGEEITEAELSGLGFDHYCKDRCCDVTTGVFITGVDHKTKTVTFSSLPQKRNKIR